jgi:phosphotransferase system  glucose/maltose/N-acetylglucosamine-specific IIC component
MLPIIGILLFFIYILLRACKIFRKEDKGKRQEKKKKTEKEKEKKKKKGRKKKRKEKRNQLFQGCKFIIAS